MIVTPSKVGKHTAPLNMTVSTKRSHGAKNLNPYKMILGPVKVGKHTAPLNMTVSTKKSRGAKL